MLTKSSEEPFVRDQPVMNTDAFAVEAMRQALETLLLNHACIEPGAPIPDDAVLREKLNLDSLDLIEIALLCEEQFSIEISDDEVDDTVTFGQLLKLVENKQAAKNPQPA